jgi:predicted O-linked N-acetylglucosamine transferase (SPINDLY family)
MALMLEPGYAEAHRNLGLALREMGVLDQAEACFQRALQIDPSSADTYLDLGGAVAAQGRFDDAAACYLKAIKLEPTRMMAYNDLGLVLQEQGDLERAAQVFTKASSLDPSCTAVLVNLGRVLHQAGRSTEAIETYRQALRVDPSCAEAHNNLGASLSDIDEIDQAFEHYLEALRIEPEFKATHYNLAQLYHQIAQAESSIEHYQKILEIDPDYSDVLGNLFHQYQYACLWDKMELLSSRLDTAIPENSGEKRSIESPFVSIARSEDPRANLKVARSRIRAMERRLTLPTRPFGFDGARGRHQRLRLGYLSNDFHGHATMLLLAGLLSEHDDDRFEIFAYSHGPADESEHRMLLVERCKDFVDISKMSDLQAAERIHADGIDVLIDLKGHTFKSRLEICAFRPAPVQVTYLGFPGTTGADFFDYIIADRVVIPPEHEPYYSEKVVCLPHCYQANDGHRVISNASLERASQGLPEEGVVFCSFNQPYKIDPATFDRWMRILRQVPGSVLWLMKRAEITAESLRREAKSRAVDPNRLIFAPYLPNAEHLARLRLADLVLDTRIVNGHTTTSDALFVGVPVVAMLGGHFASRVSASLLRAVGLPELVAGDLDGYQALALELASDPSRLSQLRQRLEVTRLTSPLFDTPRFTRGFERALEMMWDIHEAGETARGFEVIEGE